MSHLMRPRRHTKPPFTRLLRPLVLCMACSSSALGQSNEGTATEPAATAARFNFRWKGTTDCGDGDRVVTRVEQLILGSIESILSEPLAVYATVEPASNAMRLQLTLLDKLGVHERTLEGATCDELVEAAALVIGLTINPTLLAGPNPKAATIRPSDAASQRSSSVMLPQEAPKLALPPAVPAQPLSSKSAATELALEPVKPVTKTPHLFVGTSAEARFGWFPGLARGMGVHGGYELSPFAMSLSLVWLNADSKVSVPNAKSPGVNFDALLLSPRWCWLGATSAFAVGPCASTSVGIVWASAYGVAEPNPTRHWIESSSLGLMARLLHRDSAYFALEADATVPWRRTSYVLAGTEVHRPNSVGGRIAISLGLGF